MAAPTSRAPAVPRFRLSAGSLAISASSLVVFAALLPGILVRAFHVFSTDFPLNDGGMFYVMARDLQANHFVPPSTTTYNGENIPFAYPPVAIYLAALLDRITPLSLTTLFRVLPLLFSALTLVAFLQLARRVLKSELAALAAVIAFGLIPRSFIWMLMGGGLTRSFGFMFALFGLAQVHALYTEGSRRNLVLASIFGALAVASHLQAGWFLCYSTVIFYLAYSRTTEGLWRSGLFAAGVLALTMPWWLTVVAQHGLEPFLASSRTGGTVIGGGESLDSFVGTVMRVSTTSEAFFPAVAALALLGVLLCFAGGRLLYLPVWWVVIMALDLRAFATYATVPVALLAGIGVAQGLVPLLQRASSPRDDPVDRDSPLLLSSRSLLILNALLYFLCVAAVAERGGEQSSMDSLSVASRDAMTWAEQSTPADARFLVLPTNSWETGRQSEWFPALTSRVSVATVQGTEWLPDRAFDRNIDEYNRLWGCGWGDATCLDEWAQATGKPFSYVYLPDGCCSALREDMEVSPAYQKVYDRGGQVIFERIIPLP